ncbi:MAG TPA: chromate efflux transporter [Burkholderiales bacterium]
MSESDAARPAAVTFRDALVFWLKLGFISFGGPAGQIAVMHQELVERRRWISERRFLHALNYCMLLPGPEAQQLATYMGWLMHGARGGIAAGALFVLPSLVLLIVLSWIYMMWGDTPTVTGLLYGIKPAVTAIVLFAAWRIGLRVLHNETLWAITAAAFIAIYVLAVPFPAIILAAAAIGFVGGRLAPGKFASGASHAATAKSFGPALIDDDTPTPAHARFRLPGLVLVCAIGLLLWIASLGAIALWQGWDGTLTRMGWFFTKAALLTFGGAYAVLPYVVQGAVQEFHWLTPAQMIDGLALGETTPGPLIMVVAFVGFVGAWAHGTGGPDALVPAGIAGALVATWFTFLPSFLFIFAGAPLIETTHRQPALTAPLTAITAAVVGVIANLALYFALHVFWPGGMQAGVDWASVLIAAAAAVALIRFNAGIIPVILACGAAGLAIHAVRIYGSG